MLFYLRYGGAYFDTILFYRAKSYNIPNMLTFTGKKMKQGNDIMKKAMSITEKAEQTGTDMVQKLWKK
jgi:hypothetical protein